MLVYLSMYDRPPTLTTIDIHLSFVHEGEGDFLDGGTIFTDNTVTLQIAFHGKNNPLHKSNSFTSGAARNRKSIAAAIS